MTRVAFLVPLLGLSALGCGSSSSAQSGSGGSSGSGGAAGAAGDAGVAISTKSFDCTASTSPDRVSKISPACMTDRSCKERLVSGHRGAGGELGVIAPEDTLAAVRAAIAIGSDFVETDPRPTKDGVLINLHDATVDRTTNGTGTASEMTLAEVQALAIDASKFEGDFSCEHIPTFEKLLETARGKIHVLVDANKTDRVDLLVKAIQDSGTLEWAIFDTSSPDKIQQALALEPNLFTMIRVADTAGLDAQLQTFKGHPPVIVEIDSASDRKLMVPAVHAAGQRAITDVFGLDLSAKFSNDPNLYAQPFGDGLDMLESDRPELVLQYLGRFVNPP